MKANKSNKLLTLVEQVLNPDHDYDDAVKQRDGVDNVFVRPTHTILRDEASNHLDHSDYHSDKAKAAIGYSGSDYRSMNNILRHGKKADGPGNSKSDEEYKNSINNFKSLTKNPTQHEFYTYRGMDSNHLSGHGENGDIIHDKGFTSASLRPKIATNFARSSGLNDKPSLFRIHVTPGTKGHYMSGHDYMGGEKSPDEAEFVFHPGTKFRIGSTHTNLAGHKFTDLHIHSQQED